MSCHNGHEITLNRIIIIKHALKRNPYTNISPRASFCFSQIRNLNIKRWVLIIKKWVLIKSTTFILITKEKFFLNINDVMHDVNLDLDTQTNTKRCHRFLYLELRSSRRIMILSKTITSFVLADENLINFLTIFVA